MGQSSANVFERISAEYYNLTAAEKKAADYVLSHQRKTQDMSITELAAASGVAEATVSRFCRRLGCKGYNAFRLAIANSSAQRPHRRRACGKAHIARLKIIFRQIYASRTPGGRTAAGGFAYQDSANNLLINNMKKIFFKNILTSGQTLVNMMVDRTADELTGESR